jgi:hypothetical protein
MLTLQELIEKNNMQNGLYSYISRVTEFIPT